MSTLAYWAMDVPDTGPAVSCHFGEKKGSDTEAVNDVLLREHDLGCFQLEWELAPGGKISRR
jgi:hypothetical protein